MKSIKKFLGAILAVCLVVSTFSITAHAADGAIYFTDLETKVGDMFTVTGTVTTGGDVIGNVTVAVQYDTTYMNFIEGDGVTVDSAGNLTYTGAGDGSSSKLKFDMTFQAIAEGSTRIEQGQATVTNNRNSTISCEAGFADIEVGEGDPSKIIQQEPEIPATGETAGLTINGEAYSFSDAFSEQEIPKGFSISEMTYEGQTYKCIYQPVSNIYAAYLLNPEQKGEFYLYNENDNLFYPLEEIMISETSSIVVLNDSNEVKLPKKYTETAIEINGTEYPVWADPAHEGYYVFHVLNSAGEKAFYTYDSEDHTYQRTEIPTEKETTEKEKSKLDQLLEVGNEYLIWILVGAGCLIVILLVFLIVISIKLRHRNLELDDLYDEYGIDLDGSNKTTKKSKKAPQVRKAPKDDDDDDFENWDTYADDEDDYFNDEDDEYEYEDEGQYTDNNDYEYEYEEKVTNNDYKVDETDDLADLRADFGQMPSSNGGFDEFYDDDEFEEDFLEARPRKRNMNDTFEMDFIDL